MLALEGRGSLMDSAWLVCSIAREWSSFVGYGGTTQELRVDVVERVLVSFVKPDQLPLVERDSHPTPQVEKKEKEGKEG